MRSVVALGLLGAAASVAAHPATLHTGSIRKRVVDLQAFQLKAKAKYVKASVVKTDESVRMIKRADYVAAATELIKKVAPGAEFRVVNDHYVGNNGIAHVNFKQQAHGIDIDNADFNVNIATDGTIFSYGNSFFTGTLPAANPLTKREFSDPAVALTGATSTLDLPITGQPTAEKISDETYTLKGTSGTNSAPEARLVYFAKEDGSLALTWRVETDLVEADNWLLSYVDAGSSSEVLGVVDYVAHATYQVYPWGINDPSEGSRQTISDPWDPVTSEFTWLGESDTVTYNSTRGNNGIAQTNPSGGSSHLNNYRPSSPSLDFSYPFDLTLTDPTKYVDASVTQLFYTANTYHDLLHSLGFTEKAGNFETNNNGQGGLGGDNVILNSQDGSGTNNANFATPPDGQLPRMRMYIWTYSTPKRDSCFEAGVVIHEYTHGLSNRLTGGPANSNCLSAAESRGMGEGWSDFYATAIRLKSGDTAATNYPMGAWVKSDPKGIRAYPYSTSLTTNPYTYKSVGGLSGEHAIGTVWATILYEVLWGLIAVHGKNDAPKPTFGDGGVPTDGKYLAMKLVLDGLALQPCNPNFVQARDGIIDADKALTGGDNACVLWTAFAKRGLGSGAAYNGGSRRESFEVPAGVC